MSTTERELRFVDCTADSGVATVTLNRSESRNAIAMVTRDELNEASHWAVTSTSVPVIVMTSASGYFSACGDMKSMNTDERLTADADRQCMGTFHIRISELFESAKPLITAVDGCADGGSFGMALLADMGIATSAARFCMSFMKVGLVPECGALYTLVRSVDLYHAKELMFSAGEIDAQVGLDWTEGVSMKSPLMTCGLTRMRWHKKTCARLGARLRLPSTRRTSRSTDHLRPCWRSRPMRKASPCQ